MKTAAAFCLVLSLTTAAFARPYSEAEMADFNIAGVKLGMSLADAARTLKAHKYTGDIDTTSRVSSFKYEGGAVVSIERVAGQPVVGAIGLLQAVPREITAERLRSEVVPALIKRFGEPTREETAGSMTVLTYSSANAGAGAVTMTLRISTAGIDGRLGR